LKLLLHIQWKSLAMKVSIDTETTQRIHILQPQISAQPANMSDLLNKAEGFAENKLSQDAQPGDGVERAADSGVNQSALPALIPACISIEADHVYCRAG
jgi:hypothetical protein